MKHACRLLICIGVVMGVFACSRPPLHVLQDGPRVIIDMQSLGEYPSDVAGIRLMDASTKGVVWELRGRVSLIIGENPVLPADIRHGTYEVLTPAGRPTFTLTPVTKYIVEVWALEDRPDSKRSAEFVTAAAH